MATENQLEHIAQLCFDAATDESIPKKLRRELFKHGAALVKNRKKSKIERMELEKFGRVMDQIEREKGIVYG